MNENPTPWNQNSEHLKIAFLNCAGLTAHFQDIKTDKKLLKADIIHLDETHITDETDASTLALNGFSDYFINVGKGKGIATYISENITATSTAFKGSRLQIVKVSMKEIDSINVYRSTNKRKIETWETLEEFIDTEKATVITGDFNLCLRKYKTNLLLTGLSNVGFGQLQCEASQIMGGNLDHVYWRDPQGQWEKPCLERYSPFFSDHDGFLITLMKKAKKKSKLNRRKK